MLRVSPEMAHRQCSTCLELAADRSSWPTARSQTCGDRNRRAGIAVDQAWSVHQGVSASWKGGKFLSSEVALPKY